MISLILSKRNEHEVELRCSCGHWSELSLAPVQVDCGAAVLQGPIPSLICKLCGLRRLPRKTVDLLCATERHAWKEGRQRVNIDVKEDSQSSERYSYCAEVFFQYDPIDYLYTPGLAHGPHGFYAPVFFHKRIVEYLARQHAVYSISFILDSYGHITTRSHEGLEFGFNANGKVLMWLGQLDLLTIEEQKMLLPFNVPSDHSIGSDLYAQRLK